MPSYSRGVLLLVAVLLCSAAAKLDLKKQKEVEDEDLVQSLVMQGGVPEKPQNFTVFTESSSIVMVVWDKPSSVADVDHYLVYIEDEDRVDRSVECFYVWVGLEACKNYTFGVKTVSAEGNMSESALGEGMTDIAIPPGPQNLHVENFTCTSVTVAFDLDTLCPIDGFLFTLSEGKSLVQGSQQYDNVMSFSPLMPNTTYTFTFSFFNSAGNGPSATINQTTASDCGGPPKHLLAEGISSSAISVSWSAPYIEPLYYMVTAPPCMYSDEIIYDLTYLIENLNPCQRCYIIVTSYYNSTLSFSAKTSASTTHCYRPLGGE